MDELSEEILKYSQSFFIEKTCFDKVLSTTVPKIISLHETPKIISPLT
jgi:hypothetical protein